MMKYVKPLFNTAMNSSTVSTEEPPEPHEIDQLSKSKKKSKCRSFMETIDMKADATNLYVNFYVGVKR